MIVSRLVGGLGNQMFQYALGYTLSRLNSSTLKLDVSDFYNSKIAAQRVYELNIFDIRDNLLHRGKGHDVLSYLLKRRISPGLGRTFKEQKFEFDKDVLKLRGNIYLDGYWQSYKYFQNYSKDIREIFTFRKSISSTSSRVANLIKGSNSVSLHVRRGDYVHDKSTNLYHGSLPTDYYLKSVRHLNKKLKNPKFFIFSDDPAWVKNNIKIGKNSVYVAHNKGDSSWQDMYLMSLCKHNIIANSTFSWWGAWLNNNENKYVIAPKHWFRNKKQDTSDLIPSEWIRI